MEKNDPNQKFGLPADQLAKLAGLKKTLPEKELKEEEKASPPVGGPAEKEPAEEAIKKQNIAKQPFAGKPFTGIDAEQVLKAALPEEMLEWNQKIVDANERIDIFKQSLEKAIQKNDEYEIDAMKKSIEQETLRLVKLHEQEEGKKFDLEETAAWFGKTPEDTAKIIERIEGKPRFVESDSASRGKPTASVKPAEPAKEIKAAKKYEPKKTSEEKSGYSEQYLLSAIEESRIIGDKKLEAYYQSELDKLNKTKTAQEPVIKKSEKPSAAQKAETAVPVKNNMPKFEQFGPPAPKPEGKPTENPAGKPAEKIEKESGEGLAGAVIKDSAERARTAFGKKEEKQEEKTEQPKEKAEEAKEKKSRRKKEKPAEVKKEPGKEEKEEEIPLGAEAAVRPMEGEKKKPFIERTAEEKKEIIREKREEKIGGKEKERAKEVEKYKEMKKARAEYAEKAKDYYKYQTILGKFKKVFGGKEEAAKVTEEFEAAREKYDKAQAEFNGEKLLRHNAEERRRVDEIIGTRAKENSTFEKFRAAYKWLGDKNLEKLIKPETKWGKMACRMVSLRTAVGLGLGATGFGLALSAGTASAVGSALFLRKLYSGTASGLGTYEGLRMLAEKRTAISDKQIKNLDLKSANEKMAQIESWAILNGKKITEYPDYVKMRDRRSELLVGEKSVKISEALAGQSGRLNAEIDKRNRGEMYRKAAALGMGVFVGSGAMAWTFKKAFYGVKIVAKTLAIKILGEAGYEQSIEYIAGLYNKSQEYIAELIKYGKEMKQSPTPGAPSFDKSQEYLMGLKSGRDAIQMSYIETAGGKMNSVWKMTEHQLQAHFGERFNGLNAAQKTYLIDYYKDIVAKNPKAFGLENIDVVKPGQKLNFAPLFTDNANFEKGIGKALKLTAAETQNILHNNKLLREWVLSHPGEKLTSARVEELLRMPKGTMAEHFANDNMVVKPSGVTVNEIILEQEKMRTAEIVHEMGERATARILNNTIQETGLTFEEYRAIKGVSVRQLLDQAHWDNWKSGTVNLPHDGIYGGTEFARQVKLAEAIRSLNPNGGQLDMSVEDYLKSAINEGKFGARGAIEVPAGQAVLEGSPAEIEARPRGIHPVETGAKPKGTVAGVETAAETKPKVVEAAAETKGAPKFERMTNFVYDGDGKVSGAALEIKPEDTVRANGLMNDNWRETLLNNPELKNKSLAMSVIGNRARNIAAWQRMLEGLQNSGKGGSPEADYLRKAISRTVESTEKQYGDVFK